MNLTAILWNLDTDDWAANDVPGITTATVNQNYQDFITMGTNGSFATTGNIVLTHEINNMTMDFFIQHFDAIKQNYKHVVDVATCMNISHPYIEQVITFPSFDASTTKNATTATGSGVVPGASHTSGAAQTRLSGPLFIAALFGLLLVSV
jgi:hypothetical protein